MPTVQANGIEIAYETFGPAGARPLILVRGLSTQLIHWDPRLCEELSAAGHRVVVFDNRDVGCSTHLHAAGAPDLVPVLRDLAAGRPPSVPYTLRDMAADVVGLMDALDIGRAHVAGMSMGGMIVQELALSHPDRLWSLTSIMSSTGALDPNDATPEARSALFERSPSDREGYVESIVRGQRCFAGGGYPLDEARAREVAGRAFDRAYDPDGVVRQMAAVAASGDRRAALASVRTPALVIHGERDPLIPAAAGEATAAAIPGARLEILPGMGHELPEGVWPALLTAIADHTAAAQAAG